MNTHTERTHALEYLKQRIREDPQAVDLQWSIFISALRSYRHDTVLKPFPTMFMNADDEKDIKQLEKIAEALPCVSSIYPTLSNSQDDLLLNLMKWVQDTKTFTLKSVDKSQFSVIRKLTQHIVDAPKPNFIFEVVPCESSNVKFDDIRQGRQLLYAYHGSRLENFHSILHHGLASHMNKTSLYGEGTYLSSELSLCMNYSPTGLGWDNSDIGDRLSCIAVCEIINDPSVKCKIKDDSDAKTKKSRSRVPGSEGGDVPEKYYVVRNNEVMRVKYLLVYAEKSQPKGSRYQHVSWVSRNKFAVMMGVYVLILVIVGLINSKAFQNQLRKALRTY